MKSLLSRKLVIGSVGVLLMAAVGGAVAVAATQSSAGSGRQAYIDDVAKRLNVSPSAVSAAMKAAAYDRIAAAVAAARINPSQADGSKQRIEHGGVPFFGHRFGGRGLGGHGAAAQYLGISAAALRSDLQSGKSLAEIAASTPGKSVEGLKAAIMSAKRARLDHAVSSGWITRRQEQERVGMLSGRIEALLHRAGAEGARGGPGFAAPGQSRR